MGHLAQAFAEVKAIVFAKKFRLGQKLKTSKTREKRFCNNIRVVLCKKELKK